jgi:dCMP deaminase
LYLAPADAGTASKGIESFHRLSLEANGIDASERHFPTVDSLDEYVTKRWRQRWVTADIWDESVLDALQRRPFFLLVSVDAPVSLRWKRFKDRCGASPWRFGLFCFSDAGISPRCYSQGEVPPTLEEFVIQSDAHLYDPIRGLAVLIDRAEVRLMNSTSSIESLHQVLDRLNLTDEQRLRPSWDQYFMQLASLAAQRSNCMKRRVGCVLVRERRVISTGYNGTPRHLKNCNEGGCMSFLAAVRVSSEGN